MCLTLVPLNQHKSTHDYQTHQPRNTKSLTTKTTLIIIIMGLTSMTGRFTRFLSTRHKELVLDSVVDFPCVDEQPSDASDEFEFLDYGDILGHSASNDECHSNEIMELDVEEEEEDEEEKDSEENRSFWENQHQVLQANVYRTSSLESRIRHATKEALEGIKSVETVCDCNRMMASTTSCRNCLLREVSRHLQNAGYDSAICKTKWRSSPNIPAGEHNFLDIIDNTSSKKGEVRVIIELNFRAEFEMARGSEDYNGLVRRLPEVFVGKVERLSNLIKTLCIGAKRCMKEKKMHMGPWRKHKYMQAKWLGPCQRNTSTTNLSKGYSYENMPIPKPKPKKASMLTVDLALEVL
ncbi:PREDICTED: uncharacterized protein LOC109328997 isoform X2 [Lupinus angustifolius]|uniref:uncharacterized protein LOC109328997 isoform X2 n=1 Tax=Lupinus angustifolius TaxID=3871 RepID=UPI00092FD568|nr:PREDICTED: uncharacterized protein LOC109328997 isoform X2 [Lupinus angustifolius]